MKCALCGRENVLNFHHLIPRSLHTNKWFKKHFTKEELNQGIYICKRDCHKEIHIFIPEKEMGRYFNTLEKLLSHPKILNYINWIKKKDVE